MPAPPEIRRRDRTVRVAEVLLVGEAQHPPEPDRHVGIGGKVKVQLQRVEHRAEPRRRDGLRRRPLRQNGKQEAPARIGEQHLFAETDKEAAHAFRKIVCGDRARVERAVHVPVLHDRTRDQLREAAHVQQKLPEIPLQRDLFPVNVDRVGQNLKGVKRNADGQPRRGERHRNGKDRTDGRNEEPGILEVEEPRERNGDADAEPQLFQRGGSRLLHRERAKEIDQRGENEQQHHDRFAPRVKDQRKDDKNAVAPADAAAYKIQPQQQRQKQQQKCQPRKYHKKPLCPKDTTVYHFCAILSIRRDAESLLCQTAQDRHGPSCFGIRLRKADRRGVRECRSRSLTVTLQFEAPYAIMIPSFDTVPLGDSHGPAFAERERK